MKKWMMAGAAAALLALCACAPGPGGPGEGGNRGPGAAPAPAPAGAAAPSPAPAPGPEAGPAAGGGALPLPGVDAKHYPRVDGSTANLPLMAQVYATVCGVPLGDAETAVEVSTTGPAWRRLASGEADLLLAYEPSQRVRQELEEGGVPLEVKPLGRDGLVFLVSAANPVQSLAQGQLREIYTGKITDWGQVGGKEGPIAAFQRDEDSGSQTLFKKLLMGDLEPMPPPSELVPGAMGALIDGVAQYDESGGAIGYSVFYYAREMYENPGVKLLAVDGVAPSAQSIAQGSYPLLSDFYAAIRAGEPQGSPARLLWEWLFTDAGRRTLEQAGYIPAPRE